jgi:hypothetical protein
MTWIISELDYTRIFNNAMQIVLKSVTFFFWQTKSFRVTKLYFCVMCDSSEWTHTMTPKWEPDPKTEADCNFCGKCNARSKTLKYSDWAIHYNCSQCGDYGIYELATWCEFWANPPTQEEEARVETFTVDDFKTCGYACGVTDLTLRFPHPRIVKTSFCKTCKCQFRYELDEWEPYWASRKKQD